MPESTQPDGTAAPRLLDVLRQTLRVRHYSLRTEQQYVNWVRRFLRFHHHRHPHGMGAAEVSSFLTHLAVEASSPDKAQPHTGNSQIPKVGRILSDNQVKSAKTINPGCAVSLSGLLASSAGA